MHIATKIFGLVAVLALVSAPSFAATSDAKVVRDVLDCRDNADPVARLACFDKATAALGQAQSTGDIVVVDRERAREIRKSAFGFSLPSMSFFERGEKPEQIDRINAVIASVRMNSAGRWVIKLEDGATWSQTDSETLRHAPTPGMGVVIKAATMGSYFFSVDGQRSFRAHRDK